MSFHHIGYYVVLFCSTTVGEECAYTRTNVTYLLVVSWVKMKLTTFTQTFKMLN